MKERDEMKPSREWAARCLATYIAHVCCLPLHATLHANTRSFSALPRAEWRTSAFLEQTLERDVQTQIPIAN